MIIVGIDPGSQRVGYAVVEVTAAMRKPVLRDLGVWPILKMAQTAAKDAGAPVIRPVLGERLECLHELAIDFLAEWNPRWVGLEKVVHFKNAASAHTLAEARGVLRLALHQSLDQAEMRLVELSPTAVKKVAAGFGVTSKQGILKAMELRFPELRELQKKRDFDFDAFDALAIALTTWAGTKIRASSSLSRAFPKGNARRR